MEHKALTSLVDQERELNLDLNSAVPSMHFIEKVQVVARKDGLFLVRLFSQAPLLSKEEFRFIGTRHFIKQFAEVLSKQLNSDKDNNVESNDAPIREKIESTKKRSEKRE